MDPRIDDVLAFWFGPTGTPTPEITARWFKKDPAFDDEIRTRFGALYREAAANTLPWRGTARGELALLVLLDQFSRNMFRDDPQAFAADPIALGLARGLLASGEAANLTLHQQMVAVLPFEHAEDRAAQAEAVAALAALIERGKQIPGAPLAMLESFLDYARKHQAIIDRFGRFPHRNRVLGRESTDEERAFLEQPGSSF